MEDAIEIFFLSFFCSFFLPLCFSLFHIEQVESAVLLGSRDNVLNLWEHVPLGVEGVLGEGSG